MTDIDLWFERKTHNLNGKIKSQLKTILERNKELWRRTLYKEPTSEVFFESDSAYEILLDEDHVSIFNAEEGFVIDEAHRRVFYSDDAFDELYTSEFNWEEVFTREKVSESVLVDQSKKVQRILYDIYKDNSNLIHLNCWEFEEMIAELLSKQGYKVELTQKTKDNGYDIIALMNVRMHNPLKFLVECKRYTNRKVGVEVIRSFKEVIDTEKANRGIIVTTSYFTKGALQKQADVPYLLDYRDKDKVIEWVKDYFDSFKI